MHIPPEAVVFFKREGKVKLRALPTELLTQMVNAAPISRWDRGKDSLK
jgi:hypothetical protein